MLRRPCKMFCLYLALLFHRPCHRMAVIFKFSVADCHQPDGSLAAHVVVQVLVNRSEVGGLSLSVVVISGKENLISEVQNLAPAAFEVFRGGGFGSLYVLIASLIVMVFSSVFVVVCPSACTYITLLGGNSKLYLRYKMNKYLREILCFQLRAKDPLAGLLPGVCLTRSSGTCRFLWDFLWSARRPGAGGSHRSGASVPA